MESKSSATTSRRTLSEVMGDVRDRGDVIVVHRGGHTVARIVPGASGALTVGELAALLEEPLEGEKADGTRKQR